MSWIPGKAKRQLRKVLSFFTLYDLIEEINSKLMAIQDSILYHQTKQLQHSDPNPLNRFGKKCFSQTDEDGITIEILRRIGLISNGVYAEFGVGNGTENNTLILASLGWKGFWVGSEELAFKYTPNEKFIFLRDWVSLENILELTRKGMRHIHVDSVDVISLDFDGNDYYFVEKLLSNNIRPKVFIVEYNAKFPPPVEFKITYNPKHTWKNDDYFGASLSSFDKLFSEYGYRLICCNSQSGANAFFIDSNYEKYFSDIPTDIHQIYVEPRYRLYNRYGHRNSMEVIEQIFNGAETVRR